MASVPAIGSQVASACVLPSAFRDSPTQACAPPRGSRRTIARIALATPATCGLFAASTAASTCLRLGAQ